MSQIQIIGIGSPFGDDRAGWNVIEYLRQEKQLQSHIEKNLWLQHCDRPYFNLLEILKDDVETFIVDAMKIGIEIGSWRELSIEDLATKSNLISTHGFGVTDALQLAAFYKKLPKELRIFGVEIANVQGFAISPAVGNGVVNLSRYLYELVLSSLAITTS